MYLNGAQNQKFKKFKCQFYLFLSASHHWCWAKFKVLPYVLLKSLILRPFLTGIFPQRSIFFIFFWFLNVFLPYPCVEDVSKVYFLATSGRLIKDVTVYFSMKEFQSFNVFCWVKNSCYSKHRVGRPSKVISVLYFSFTHLDLVDTLQSVCPNFYFCFLHFFFHFGKCCTVGERALLLYSVKDLKWED